MLHWRWSKWSIWNPIWCLASCLAGNCFNSYFLSYQLYNFRTYTISGSKNWKMGIKDPWNEVRLRRNSRGSIGTKLWSNKTNCTTNVSFCKFRELSLVSIDNNTGYLKSIWTSEELTRIFDFTGKNLKINIVKGYLETGKTNWKRYLKVITNCKLKHDIFNFNFQVWKKIKIIVWYFQRIKAITTKNVEKYSTYL